MQGLIVSSRKESVQHFKKPWAHEHEPVKDLLSAVKVCTREFLGFETRMENFETVVDFSFDFPGAETNSSDRVIWCRKNIY